MFPIVLENNSYIRAIPEIIVWLWEGVGKHFLYDPTIHQILIMFSLSSM